MAPLPGDATTARGRFDPLRNRVLSALVLVPIALAVVVQGGLLFDLVVAVSAAQMAHEWSRLTGRGRIRAADLLLGAAGIALVAATALGSPLWQGILATMLVALLIYGLARVEGVEAPRWLAAGAIAIAVPCLAFVWLRHYPVDGRQTVLWLLAVVWATDIGAYGFGRWLGGPRLAPRISPNKTWAGLVGGVVSAALASAGSAWLMGSHGVVLLALVGGLLAVVAQAGDLGESLAKRRFGVKDTGQLIPGHGGLLDRVDGLMATAPLVALAVWLNGGSVFRWA